MLACPMMSSCMSSANNTNLLHCAVDAQFITVANPKVAVPGRHHRVSWQLWGGSERMWRAGVLVIVEA